jgi:aromatic ring-opening dioxygenase catalytic subunit (LigB family)
MRIVGAFACSHAALFVTRREAAPEAQCSRIYGAFARMGQLIREHRPDALVIVGTDHGRIYPLSGMPQYLIGVSEQAVGIGDAGLPGKTLPLHQGFARSILDSVLEEGVDMAFSEAMRIDHSFLTPLLLALPELDIPIVPIVQNCNAPPLPKLERAYQVGQILARALMKGPEGRIVVIGTGGLSHWVGSAEFRAFMSGPAGSRLARQTQFPLQLPDTGEVNEEFDREFIESVCRGRAQEFIRNWDTHRIGEVAGNGAQEVRNWLLLAGLTADAPATLLDYAPVKPWLTGVAVVQFVIPEPIHPVGRA